MDKDTFYSVMADSDIKVYVFQTEYMAEEMQRKDAEAVAALAVQEDSEGADHPEPELLRANSDSWFLCSNCPPMPKETESFCCNEFQRGQFLLDAVANSERGLVNYYALKFSSSLEQRCAWRPSGF